MPNPKISVIIAAYNTAEYLPLCLDSLLAQSMTDWEAVCVDDGSTDLTLEVLHRYAADDKRIRVIHSAQNQGAAKARNIALA
ncbi:MAG: glycosyltransferase family 2 protein, partial [Bacteroidaceae bacterium]|nr:glycosyltransferase family 2 protein [Bacteroidaceae bacterium]